MPLHLYNTYAKADQEFIPLEQGRVRMYTCGPTVYGRPHVGNYASFLLADLLRRWLEAGQGYTVTHVKNITDVGHLVADADEGEDKVEKQARVERLAVSGERLADAAEKEDKTAAAISRADVLAIVAKYTEQYLADERALHMLEPAERPRATETIPEMLQMIRALQERGHAYETDDGIYFRVESFDRYGRLSGNTLDKLDAGARVEVGEHKEHPADFALWKKCVGGNARHVLRWEFATGAIAESAGEDPAAGFPGWHIECSAMSTKFLGQQIDIHTGGEDNIFPHHECEIAQSECAGDLHPFVRTWVHRRRIQLGEEKMSKSLGNILTVPDIIEAGYAPMDLRYYLLSVHYRTNLKFTEKGLEDAHKARRKIMEWMEEAESWSVREPQNDEKVLGATEVAAWVGTFDNAMNADLNTPAALAAIFDMLSISRTQTFDAAGLEELRAGIAKIRHTFGCFDPEQAEIPEAAQALATERDAARASKDFAASDRLRDELVTMGYEVRDTEEGTQLRRL